MRTKILSTLAVVALAIGGAVAIPLTASAAEDCRTIPVNADSELKSDLARADFGVDGTGIKVGVISDSFNQVTSPSSWQNNIAQGLLPGEGNPCGWTTPVTVLSDGPVGSTDEGRAMAQAVHGVAPGAQLFFAEGLQEGLPRAIERLTQAGVDIIVDDLIGYEEASYQPSKATVAVENAVASGVTYLTAAGNNTVVDIARRAEVGDLMPIGHWETTAYRPAPCDPSIHVTVEAPFTGYDCMDFDAGEAVRTISSRLTVPANLRTAPGQSPVKLGVILQWAESFDDARASFRLHVSGGTAEGTSLTNEPRKAMTLGNIAIDVPPLVEGDIAANEVPLKLSIVRMTTGSPETDITPALRMVFPMDGAPWAAGGDDTVSTGTDLVGRSISGHNGAPSALTIAATGAGDEGQLEGFSSLGPVRQYFDAEGKPLPEPVLRSKPNVLSVDGIWQNVLDKNGEAAPGIWIFDGTSAATPTAGAVAALALQLNPALTPAELGALIEQTTTPDRSIYASVPNQDAVGTGLVNAQALLTAVQATLPAPSPDNPVVRPALAASGMADTGTAVPLGLALLALGLAAVATVRVRRRVRGIR